MNSKNKGKVGERELAKFLRDHGFRARRGQQFAGGCESPDVICDCLSNLHIEVKRCERWPMRDWISQAKGDAHGKPWVVFFRRNHDDWLVCLSAEVFLDVIKESHYFD